MKMRTMEKERDKRWKWGFFKDEIIMKKKEVDEYEEW